MNNELPTTDNWRLVTLFDSCRGISTNRPTFMQNEPKFRKSQMNVKSLVTMYYENTSDWTLGQNEPNSNPNKPNLRKAQNERNLNCDKRLRQYLPLWSSGKQSQFKANSNPISEKPEMSTNSLLTSDYENKPLRTPPENRPDLKTGKLTISLSDLSIYLSRPWFFAISHGALNEAASEPHIREACRPPPLVV